MQKASIICIGNELLNGQTVNTNAAYLGRKLVESKYAWGSVSEQMNRVYEMSVAHRRQHSEGTD